MSISPSAVLVDVIAVFFLIFFALRGRKRGLIRTLTGILALVIAFWGAGILAQQTSPYLSSKYVEPWIYNAVLPTVSESQSVTAVPDSEAEVTETLGGAFKEIGIPRGAIQSFFNDFVINLTDSLEHIVENASKSIGYKLTYAILFLLYFLLLYLLLRLAAKLVELLAKIPGINFVNKTLGLLLGLISGYLVVLILSFILTTTGVFLTPQLVSETYVLQYLVNFSPLSLFA